MEYKKITTDAWTTKAHKVHGNLYDYSKVEYKGACTKIIIVCKVHGEFLQTPTGHLSNKGCKKCSDLLKAQKRKDSKEQFISKVRAIHGDLYDLSKVEYVNSRTPVIVCCNKCGTTSLKVPKRLVEGAGCSVCNYNNKRMSLSTFVCNAKAVHDNKYDYSEVVYKNNSTKVTLKCTKCNNTFLQSPTNHLQGQGCNKCNSSGFNHNKPAILYYLEVKKDEDTYYKIGITNRTVDERFTNTELKHIRVINTIPYIEGSNAFNEEQRLLKKYKYAKYDGEPILNSGNTELLTCKIPELESY